MTISQGQINGLCIEAKGCIAFWLLEWGTLPGSASITSFAESLVSINRDFIRRIMEPFLEPDKRDGHWTVICGATPKTITQTADALADLAGTDRTSNETDDSLLSRALGALLIPTE